ncbi:hypothetical protein GCM10007377_12060 [Galliscardovia ingluviei]|uniref:Leucine rich repeat variant domain-containing protein n=1 Tax=Galliscardovia ingluviei TaxID=1769422 RepID=A0A8J3APY8_9BIFI|nr:hypothetical protein [Galliscardovia ingluviei]GGI14666.1 hypothetical protein GCM10007377_12060 [Galliscardovia ingluviei]
MNFTNHGRTGKHTSAARQRITHQQRQQTDRLSRVQSQTYQAKYAHYEHTDTHLGGSDGPQTIETVRQFSAPPRPPQQLNANLASDPDTHILVLWHIAQHIPRLRKWVIANSAADAQLLEYIAQQGGPGVEQAFEALFSSMK